MRSIVRAGIVSAAATGMLAAGGLTTSASAQPINVGNLVNVNISNVANNNDVVVTVPINAAANICGVAVNVAVLAETAGTLEDVTCRARGNQTVTLSDVTD